MIRVYVMVGVVVWLVGAGVFYEEPERGGDSFPVVARAFTWPLWLVPRILFDLGQKVRRLIGRALDIRDARKADKPRSF